MPYIEPVQLHNGDFLDEYFLATLYGNLDFIAVKPRNIVTGTTSGTVTALTSGTPKKISGLATVSKIFEARGAGLLYYSFYFQMSVTGSLVVTPKVSGNNMAGWATHFSSVPATTTTRCDILCYFNITQGALKSVNFWANAGVSCNFTVVNAFPYKGILLAI